MGEPEQRKAGSRERRSVGQGRREGERERERIERRSCSQTSFLSLLWSLELLGLSAFTLKQVDLGI